MEAYSKLLRRVQGEVSGGAGHGDHYVQTVRKNLQFTGKRSALAQLLPGVPGQIPARGADHEEMPRMREALYLPVQPSALAELLPHSFGPDFKDI